MKTEETAEENASGTECTHPGLCPNSTGDCNGCKWSTPICNNKERLEHLRAELRAERISTEELLELQSLAPHIDKGDVELLEAAGVPENDDGEKQRCNHCMSVFDESLAECPTCGKDDALMCPYEPGDDDINVNEEGDVIS